MKECSDGGKFNIHSMEELLNKGKLIIFFSIILIQIIIINIITPIKEIIDPKEDTKFHLAKKSG